MFLHLWYITKITIGERGIGNGKEKHIFTCILYLLRVYCEFIKRLAPSSGLIDQLVEHCTGIAEVMGSNPVQALISQLLKLCA